mgnify:CR=1 FL=1
MEAQKSQIKIFRASNNYIEEHFLGTTLKAGFVTLLTNAL